MKNNNTGPIRRADLNLRAEYPEFKTSIYRIDTHNFLIHIENLKDDFAEVNKQFEEKIKPLLTRVKLTIKKPKDYLQIVPNMLDTEISKGLEGISMTKSDWLKLLHIKFPTINFYKITDDAGIINIHIANYQIKEGNKSRYIYPDKFSKESLAKFIENHKSSMTFNIIEDNFDEVPTFNPGYQEDGETFVYIKGADKKTPYTQRDEALWFDNVDSIFEGNFKKKDLFFFDEEEYSCYVDFSVFPNIDLRYHLLLYQLIYITPPLEKNIDEWLKTFDVSRNEFIELIARRRIKLILTQLDERYDVRFLQEVHEIMPDSVISRRGISCLQQCDIVEISDNYLFNDFECIQELKTLSDIVSKTTKVDPKLIYNMLSWPIKARRESFEILQRGSVMSASVYGVNKIIENPSGKNISEGAGLLMNLYSPSIHLAHALNATYFPFQNEDGHTDEKYADMLGKMLNFFKYSTLDGLKTFVDVESLVNKGNKYISPINLVKVDSFNSILEFEEIMNKEIVFPNSKRLIETLSSLTPDEQIQKVAYYNNEVSRYLKRKENYSKTFDLSAEGIKDIIGIFTGIPTGLISSVAKMGSSKIFKDFSPFKAITNKIEQAMDNDVDTNNIHFLSKINRAVKLRNLN